MTHLPTYPCHFCNAQAIIRVDLNSAVAFKLCEVHLAEWLSKELSASVAVMLFAQEHNVMPERRVPKSTDETAGEYRTDEHKEE